MTYSNRSSPGGGSSSSREARNSWSKSEPARKITITTQEEGEWAPAINATRPSNYRIDPGANLIIKKTAIVCSHRDTAVGIKDKKIRRCATTESETSARPIQGDLICQRT